MTDGAPCSVSVVAATYARRDRLQSWVTAVLADREVDEVVVVVDGCDDGSFELLQELARGDARLQPLLVPNGGQFRALQAGAEHSSGDVVLFLDDDVVPHPGLAAAHANHHAPGSMRLVLGYMPVRLPPRTAGAVATYVYARQYETQCDAYERDPNEILENLWAGNFSMRREDALAIGLVWAADGGARSYHHDREFGLRCRAAGVIPVFDRSLRAEHLHTRDVSAIVTEAEKRARGAVQVHELHPAELGPWRPDAYGRDLRRPLRAALPAARVPVVAAVLVSVLKAALLVTGTVGLYRAQDAVAVLLMNVVEISTGIRLTRDATPEDAADGP